MQGSLAQPQRLSLQFLATLQSHRRFGIRSGGCSSFSHWTTLEFAEPGDSDSLVQSMLGRTGPGVANELAWQGTVTLKSLGFVGNKGNTRMRGLGFSSFATTSLCNYKTEVARSVGFCREILAPGKSCSSVLKSSCGIPKQVQHQSALQWPSRQSHRGYARKPAVVVAGKNGGQELLAKEGLGFKRVVSQSDSTTTLYRSDISSFSEDDAVEDGERAAGKKKMKKKTKGPKAYAEDSDSESDSDDEELKGTDHRKVKLRAPEKTDKSKREKKACGKYDDITTATGEMAGKSEDSDSESEDEDEEEEKDTKDEKKSAKAKLKLKEKLDEDFQKSMQKLKEKLDKDFLKAMKEEENNQKKEAKKLKALKKSGEEIDSDEDGNKKMKLDLKGKNDEESDSDSESDEEDEHNVKAKSKLKITGDLASDSEYEDEDDGVRDLGDEAVEKDEENLVMEEDEIAASQLENEFVDEVEEELDDLDEEDDFWDDEEGDVVVGDGGTGGGVVLGGKEWGKKALELAEQVVAECGKDLSIFAFKISSDRVIRVRLDKLSDRYGSPTMTDVEGFSRRFSIALEEAGEAGSMPKDMDVEVSSPGAERVVRVPDDLERFKELPMFVRYLEGETDLQEKDGVFELDSLNMEAGLSVWKIANVKLNREVKGPGRPLNSKQKKWRASVPFASLKQVRLYIDV